MSSDARAVIRRVPAFADLTDDELDTVLATLKARRGNPGDVLFRQGDPGESLVIVLDGELAVRVDGNEVARLGRGEVVGEVAFVDAQPRSATIETVTGATVIELTRSAVATLRRSAPRVARGLHRNILLDVARRLREAGERLSDGAPIRRSAGDAAHDALPRPGRGLVPAQLRALEAFAHASDEDLELLAHIATVKSFSVGEVLMREGDSAESCFLIARGAVDVSRGAGGQSIATLRAGALVGQLALLDRAPRAATVRASVDTVVLEVPATAFASLLAAASPIALRFQWQVAVAGVRQLREATERIAFAASRASQAPAESLRMLDDWDAGDDDDAPALELAVDPRSLRR